MITKVVIASTKVPMKHAQQEFLNELHKLAKERQVSVLAVLGMQGFGCYNYGIKIEGDNWEQFVREITMALMPAKYSLCADNFDGFVFNNLKDTE